MSLFQNTAHTLHPHKPRNINRIHQQEMAGFNDRIAVFLTGTVGSMPTAYLFVVLAFIGLLAIIGVLNPIIALLVAWASQTLIQLALLPIIMVGQNVLNRKQELQADEQYNTTQKSYYDIEQIMLHLEAQSVELIKHTNMLEALQRKEKS